MPTSFAIVLVFLACLLASVASFGFHYLTRGDLTLSQGLKIESARRAGDSERRPHRQNRDPLPMLPVKFITNWTIYNIPSEDPPPPFADEPPPPYSAGRGATYYDWSKRAIIEEYYDFCVPIFQNGSNWRCHFLNVGGAAYLISLDKASPYPPCCVFGKPWSPPSPPFVKVMPYNKTTMLFNKPVDWYILNGPMPDPFGYGWFRDTLPSGERIPASFWFRAAKGWSTQRFHNFRVEEPPDYVFGVPKECLNAKNCGYLT